MKIESTIRHEAVVKTPVHFGNSIEEHTISHMDRLTGKLTTKQVQTSKPIIGLVNTVIIFF